MAHLATMIKQKFDLSFADSIFTKMADKPLWLQQMMSDSAFRKMFIELYDKNRSSVLIKVALTEMCNEGYHR